MFEKAEYWLALADDAAITARLLLDGRRYLHMAFFCHLLAEEALKAAVADAIDGPPPKTHDLVRLAKHCAFSDHLTVEQRTLLSNLLQYQIEARYPECMERVEEKLDAEYCRKLLMETEEFLQWIKKMLGK